MGPRDQDLAASGHRETREPGAECLLLGVPDSTPIEGGRGQATLGTQHSCQATASISSDNSFSVCSWGLGVIRRFYGSNFNDCYYLAICVSFYFRC